jgi:hypothetical protein
MLEYFFLQLLGLVLVTEAIVELVIKSEIFRPVREQIFKAGDWFKKLFSCGYCFSVWVATGLVFLSQTSYPLVGNKFLDLALAALVVHRLSNILHNVIDKWTDKYYDMRYVNTEKEH